MQPRHWRRIFTCQATGPLASLILLEHTYGQPTFHPEHPLKEGPSQSAEDSGLLRLRSDAPQPWDQSPSPACQFPFSLHHEHKFGWELSLFIHLILSSHSVPGHDLCTANRAGNSKTPSSHREPWRMNAGSGQR
uniref:Uncharacterized protein n=1 Tax=Macaca fascicularis TaxID=9541 RepID=Q9GM07_MACFA|nr:hypothetical protein [Macaca fascicularis]